MGWWVSVEMVFEVDGDGVGDGDGGLVGLDGWAGWRVREGGGGWVRGVWEGGGCVRGMGKGEMDV